MSKGRSLCLVNCHLGMVRAFEELGHRVLALEPSEPVFDIREALAEAGFEPDVLIQTELLRDRVLLRGLDGLSCRKVFWSLDTHLNSFWHAHYGRLFDGLLSTQKRLLPELRAAGLSQVGWLPWFGFEAERLPWSGRENDLAFVGRVSAQRPSRQWFVEFLKADYSPKLARDVGFADLVEIYRQTRLAPNESICGEVNFRLFEAASCGCLVLNQLVSPELAELFVPGREIETFGHVLELKSKLDFYLRHKDKAEALGLAARARVLAGHLPIHRAEQALCLADSWTARAARGPDADAALALTLFALWEAGRSPLSGRAAEGLLLSLPEGGERLCALIRLWAVMGRDSEVLSALLGPAAPAECGQDPLLAATCSMAALKLGHWGLARQFWYAFARAHSRGRVARPQGGPDLCRLWARELADQGRLLRPGFAFDAERHVPVSALECLMLGLNLDPGDADTHRLLSALSSGVPGAEPARLGFLSTLCLRAPGDWRLGLDLALTSLEAFRLREGLAELLLAQETAADQAEERAFLRALKARDKAGLLSAALRGPGTQGPATADRDARIGA
ncbi:MAG: glycosyltransferase family 1 protein [Desulfovibrionaceae bacterium]|nr:glycosyltransferase family 1 protein [Desulfovibrionaceae bacterium]